MIGCDSMKKFWWQVPAILYTILIFLLSSISQSDIPHLRFRLLDKWVHFVEFAIYAGLLMLAFRMSNRVTLSEKAWIWTLGWGTIYAGLDEIHQLYVPGRDCAFGDYAADIGGILIGLVIYHLIEKRGVFHKIYEIK